MKVIYHLSVPITLAPAAPLGPDCTARSGVPPRGRRVGGQTQLNKLRRCHTDTTLTNNKTPAVCVYVCVPLRAASRSQLTE